MFGFDMMAHGIQESQLLEDVPMSDKELEVYEINWKKLQNSHFLESQ